MPAYDAWERPRTDRSTTRTAARKCCAPLRLVDAVMIFDQDTPLELIQAIGPDVLVKGWRLEARDRS
jgi:bifunctional ADP-heptose synthase (sugar kinase/adenylyltransferase)